MKNVRKCRGTTCSAAIVWCLTAGDRKMPMDVQASAEGAWRISEPDADVPNAFFVKKEDRAGATDLHMSHWATCPDRESFKKRKAAR